MLSYMSIVISIYSYIIVKPFERYNSVESSSLCRNQTHFSPLPPYSQSMKTLKHSIQTQLYHFSAKMQRTVTTTAENSNRCLLCSFTWYSLPTATSLVAICAVSLSFKKLLSFWVRGREFHYRTPTSVIKLNTTLQVKRVIYCRPMVNEESH